MRLRCFTIRGDKQTLRAPAVEPFTLTQTGGVEVVSTLSETATASTDSNSTIGYSALDLSEPVLEYLEATLFLESLGPGGIAPELVLSLSDRHRESLPNALHATLKAPSFGEQVAEAKLPGVLRGARDRARPTGGGLFRC
jgi:hypothetical protein